MLLLTVIITGTGCTRQVSGEEVTDTSYVPVETEKAVINTIANTTRFSGKIVANKEVSVIPKTVGVVASINVKQGDKVTKDTVLFTLEKEDILKSVEQAQNSVNLASKSVEQATNGVRTANINYEMSKDQLENAKVSLERTKALYEAGAVSKAQLEQAEMAASEKGLEIAKGQVLQAEISLQQAQGQLRQAEISYEQALSNSNNTLVKAPIDGYVSILNIQEGQIATNSQVAAVIVDTNELYMQLNVVEKLVNRLYLGQDVKITIPAAYNEGQRSTINFISPSADARTQLYPVKIYLGNDNQSIKPGMNGEAILDLDQVENAVVIKSNAVLDKAGQRIVYVVENEVAVERTVTVGLDTGAYVEITEGITAGDEVIVKGQHYVEAGQKVKVVRGE